MRAPIAAALILAALQWSPAMAANTDYWDGDRYLECLVGKGAVAMRHGASADDAISSVRDQCEATTEPVPDPEPEGEWGDYVDYIFAVAVGILTAADEHGGIF